MKLYVDIISMSAYYISLSFRSGEWNASLDSDMQHNRDHVLRRSTRFLSCTQFSYTLAHNSALIYIYV